MKLRHYTIIITLALLAASCAHEESEVAQISDVQVIIEASFTDTASETKATTKATATAFESGDLLGLYAVKSGGELSSQSNLINNHQLKVAESGAIVGDQLPAYYPDKSSSLDLFSYFPYQSGNATADALGVLVGIRTHQTDFSSLMASDFCYGRKLDAAPSAAPHPLQFRHSFAQLRLNFSLYEGCSAIATVKLLSIKDSAKLNLQTGLVTLLPHVADVDPFVNNLLSYTAIIPAQSLSGACIEIILKDGTIYYYHATAPIPLKESATNTLNLTLSDKGKLTLASTPAITAWGVESTISNISESTDNAFTFYWSPAITSFGSIDKAFITLTNPATKKSARIEVAAFVRDATSTAANAIFRFAITRTDAASIGYPVTIDKFELFNGGTAVHTLTDYYGRTVTRSGAHTFGTVTSIKLSPDGDWLNAANTAQSRAVTIATTGSTSWVASASPSGIGLSVSPTSGANSATATISWAAQLTTGDSPLRSGTVTFTTVPDGVSYVVSTSQLMGPYYLAVNPATAWANVANTAQSRSHAIATGNLAGWTATATSTPTAGLTVTASGTSTNGIATPAVATWAAQAVGALARTGSVTITPNPATVGGVATAPPITIATNQAAGPAPTLTLAKTDAIDNPIPAGGKAYKATITSNHAWTASALTNLTIDKSKGAAGTTAVVVTIAATTSAAARPASVVFTTDAVPSKATASQTWAGSQGAASIVLDPAGDWTNAANTQQTKAIKVTTYGIGTWSAAATGTGLSVTGSGNSGGNATVTWAAQAAGALARSGSVKFSSGSATPITIKTSQVAGPAPTLTLTLTDAIDNPIPAGGKQYKTTITSNHAWTASALTNVTLDKSKGAAGATAVVVTVAATTSAAARPASVVFTTDAVPSKATATQTWSGSQGAASIVLDPAGDWANAANTQQTKAIKVTTYGIGTWSAAATGTGLSVTGSGNSGGSATVTWAAQAAGALARSGTVTFSSGSATSVKINTSQVAGPAPTLTLAKTDAIDNPIPAGGKQYKTTITSNTAWTASALTNVTLDKSKGAAGATVVVVTVAATTSAAARAASVVFTTDAVPSTAKATQTWSGSQGAASIVLDPAGDWTNAANTQQTKAIKVTTYGIGTWSAAATGTGLSVTGSGNSGGNATVTWAAQAAGALVRSGSVKFSSGSATPITIKTSQVAGPAPALTLSSYDPGVIVPATGGSYTITITSNTPWKSGNISNGAGASNLKINIPVATRDNTAVWTTKFITDAVPSGVVVTKEWKCTQEAAAISLNPAGNWANVANTAQTRTINATTTTKKGWTASATGTGLSVTTSGNSGGGANISWTNNSAIGATARSGSITFTSENAKPVTIATNQLAGPAPTLTLSSTTPGQTVPKAGGTYYANVTSNTAWKISTDYGAYVTITPTSGTGNYNNVKIVVAATAATATRPVNAKFATNAVASGAVASQTWSGTQAAGDPANAVNINGLWWSTMNVGATSITGYGNDFTFDQAQTACPSGFRTPTSAEFLALDAAGRGGWTTYNGINGRWFGPNASSANSATAIFLPAGGQGNLSVGARGFFWTSTPSGSSAYRFGFASTYVRTEVSGDISNVFSVRCVQ